MLDQAIQNRKIAVLGLGMEGLAVAEFLLENGISDLTLLDRAKEEEIFARVEGEERDHVSSLLGNPKVKKDFGQNYLDSLDQYEMIFRTPGISALDPSLATAKKAGVEITSQIKLFFDLCPCLIIGVTGTKGKGTTSSLILDILKKAGKDVYLAGNIGAPAISLIPKLKPESIVILELSSFQLMDLHKSPQIAVVINLEIDHLDYHANVNEYHDAKYNILQYQTEKDLAVLNFESTFPESKIKSLKSKAKYFSAVSPKDALVGEENVVLDPNGRMIEVCDLSKLHVFGRHNLANIAAASLVADSLNVDIETIREAVKDFRGLPHRIEYVDTIDGVKFIDDSFATNPDPTMAAIHSFSEPKILILGGSSKRANFDDLAQDIQGSQVKKVILIGAEKDKIRQSLEKAGYRCFVEATGDINDIVVESKNQAESGDVVIFSPACASFDMFKNYKDRGEKFKNAVLQLSSGKIG